jgi:hypothetical protein
VKKSLYDTLSYYCQSLPPDFVEWLKFSIDFLSIDIFVSVLLIQKAGDCAYALDSGALEMRHFVVLLTAGTEFCRLLRLKWVEVQKNSLKSPIKLTANNISEIGLYTLMRHWSVTFCRNLSVQIADCFGV